MGARKLIINRRKNITAMELTGKQKALEYTQCPVCKENELEAMDSVGDEAPFLWCGNCETTIDGEGTVQAGEIPE